MKATIGTCPNQSQLRIVFPKQGFAPMLYLEYMAELQKAGNELIVFRYAATKRFFVIRIDKMQVSLGVRLVGYINANQ
jgi:hypothetical protein